MYDSNIKNEYELDLFRQKIKDAQEVYNKALCDDDKDASLKIDTAFHNLQILKHEFKEKFNISYDSLLYNSQDNLMTAAQARELYNETIERDNIELNEILEKIKNAIIERKQDYCYVSTMKDYTKTKLERLGYTIIFNCGVDNPTESSSYTIKF